ncbi:hypothetical protein LY76DRAFT_344235 [Colletotrichum caudatum]|nr:hypothetical protein LY76DRAFT_344235 [Colletotrichum caudatum]
MWPTVFGCPRPLLYIIENNEPAISPENSTSLPRHGSSLGRRLGDLSPLHACPLSRSAAIQAPIEVVSGPLYRRRALGERFVGSPFLGADIVLPLSGHGFVVGPHALVRLPSRGGWGDGSAPVSTIGRYLRDGLRLEKLRQLTAVYAVESIGREPSILAHSEPITLRNRSLGSLAGSHHPLPWLSGVPPAVVTANLIHGPCLTTEAGNPSAPIDQHEFFGSV